jgi:predicted RNase H-like HicB family nuclease
MATYCAVFRRVGNWWAISVPELKGAHTRAGGLDQVAAMGQDAIASLLNIDPASVHVEVIAAQHATPPASAVARQRRAARDHG